MSKADKLRKALLEEVRAARECVPGCDCEWCRPVASACDAILARLP